MCVQSKLTVFFDDPFWVGVCERIYEGRLEVARIVFGSEPRDCEVCAFFLSKWYALKFSSPVAAGQTAAARVNPKRVQRLISKQLQQKGPGTKAQQALKLQQEEGKTKRRQENARIRQAEAQRKFGFKQVKKKQKHKGR